MYLEIEDYTDDLPLTHTITQGCLPEDGCFLTIHDGKTVCTIHFDSHLEHRGWLHMLLADRYTGVKAFFREE
jgi:hypothetical protein